ncbi:MULTISPECIES: DUF2252 domain-containing protein [unclassified Streptomyces]|uniref:DUF2252 domain-containing protein n=1 Tax=unclassified Streptomyces TaxID=2593676 RepID=UPI0023661EE4|nr:MULTISPECIES: DUF2252 domain-containing protein [unclassified Streptomyces]MDF3146404.1 DUF2252 domain-containing protein [Streptomyces sp. T21Q-yed]WDF37777.1 DUF2252 domain-containing protein [Streptomyces sp. T12]
MATTHDGPLSLVNNGPLSPAERAARGKEARARVPRSGHAVYEPDEKRPDPVDIIDRQSGARVPELVPVRYGRMLESPFRFYRGAAAIMASDLGASAHTGLYAQLCGDAHLLNFRLLASPERHLVFDINDFDETLPGPFEWDVKRLAASLVIAGRANGFPAKACDTLVRAAVESYRERMREFAALPTLDVWYARDDFDQIAALLPKPPGKEDERRASRAAEKARSRTSLQAAAKLTRVVDGQHRIISDPPLITPLTELLPGTQGEELGRTLRELVAGYADTLSSERRHLLSRFHVADMARKVVGVGSVGTRCWIILLLGRDDEDPLLLQAKEAGESVLAPHCGASPYENQGERVVAGQRLMQAASDIFLGWKHVTGFDGRERDFYVRQLRDWKGIARPETMDAETLGLFARLCGAALARAHARSGDPIAIAAYLGRGDTFDRALVQFAQAYADQNERDHRALADAVTEGRVTARTDLTA